MKYSALSGCIQAHTRVHGVCRALVRANIPRLCCEQIELCEALDGITDVSRKDQWHHVSRLNRYLTDYSANQFVPNNKGTVAIGIQTGDPNVLGGPAETPIAEPAWTGLLSACKMSR